MNSFPISTQFRAITRGTAIAVVGLLGCAGTLSAEDKKADGEKITFRDHILPLLENKCLNCHNPDEAKGGLDLSNYGGAMTGGSGGEVVTSQDADSSRIYNLMAHQEEPFMPPKKTKSSDAELELVKKWIEGGLLEHDGSVAKVSDKPKLDMNVKVDIGSRPDVVAMPEHLLLQPEVVTERANAIPALARSPWAPIIAVAGQKQVMLYDSNNFEILGILAYPEGFPKTLSFSQNGSLLLCGGGRGGKSGGVVVWDVKTGERAIEVGNEFDIVLAADISPDQRNIALGGPGRNIKIFDTVSGEELHSIKKHPDWLLTLAYSPDGVLLASGGRNGDLYIWEAATGIEFYTLNGHSSAVTDVSWRSDSNLLVSVSEDGEAMLWEMSEGKQVKKWAAHPGGALAVDFSLDGKIVTTGRDKTVKIWDVAGKQLQSIAASDDLVMAAVFSEDSSKVISGDYNGKIVAWNVADGKKITEFEANPPTIDQQLAYSQKRIAELRGSLPKLEQGIKVAATELTAKQQALAAAAKQATDATSSKAAMEKQAAEMKVAVDRLSAEKVAAQKALVAKQADAKAKADALVKDTQILTAAKADIAKWTAETKKQKPTIAPLVAALAAAKAEVDKPKIDAATQTALNAANADLAAKTKARDAVQAQLTAATTAKQELSALQAQLVTANAALAAATATASPLRDKATAAQALQAKVVADHTAKTAQHAAAVKALNDAKAQLAAATKRNTDGDARLKAAQAADTAAKAAVSQANTLLATKTKELNDTNAKFAAANAEVGKIVAQVEAVTKQKTAAEAAIQAITKKQSESKQAVELAKADLQTSEYMVKKWQAAAVNLEAFEKTEELDEMEVALDAVIEQAATKKSEAEKAVAARTAAELTLAKAEQAIKEGTRNLVEKSDDVLETVMRLAKAKALAGLKTETETVANSDEPVTLASTEQDAPETTATAAESDSPPKTEATDSDAKVGSTTAKSRQEVEAELAEIQKRLATLKNYISGAYSDALKTQEAIQGASKVAAETPAVVTERARVEAEKKAAMADAMAEKQQQESVVTNRKKEIESLRSKYLKLLPKKPAEEKPAEPSAEAKPAAAATPAPVAKK